MNSKYFFFVLFCKALALSSQTPGAMAVDSGNFFFLKKKWTSFYLNNNFFFKKK